LPWAAAIGGGPGAGSPGGVSGRLVRTPVTDRWRTRAPDHPAGVGRPRGSSPL